jgi:DNA gyrase inhibitor GyrI
MTKHCIDAPFALRKRLALLIAVIAGLAFAEPAMAIEQPKYDVRLKDGDFEIRRYAPYIVAEVVVSGDQGQTVQKGFRKLAGYIFGGNAGRATIAMTAPVAQTPEGEKIAMTSPVTQSPAAEGRWTVQFMMPAAYTLNNLPKPNDPDIHFRVEPARDMAVLHFSGVAREPSYREKTSALKSWATAKGLAVRGSAVLAQYDPPWTPWFMRRNEVLLEIAP